MASPVAGEANAASGDWGDSDWLGRTGIGIDGTDVGVCCCDTESLRAPQSMACPDSELDAPSFPALELGPAPAAALGG